MEYVPRVALDAPSFLRAPRLNACTTRHPHMFSTAHVYCTNPAPCLCFAQAEFVEEGALERALELVQAGGGIEGARALAREQVGQRVYERENYTD